MPLAPTVTVPHNVGMLSNDYVSMTRTQSAMRVTFGKIIYLVMSLLLLAGCNLTTADRLPTPIPTPDIPRTEILEPPNNVQIIEGTEFNIDIVARDETVGIDRVVLSIDEVVVNAASPQEDGPVNVFRVTMNWRATGVGRHIIEAVAYRADDTPSDPAVLNVDVLAPE